MQSEPASAPGEVLAIKNTHSGMVLSLDNHFLASVLNESVKRSRFVDVQYGEMSRDAVSFEPFPAIPGVDPGQLEQWIQAIHVDAVSAIEWKWKESWKVGPRTIQDSMWFFFLKGSGHGWVGTPKDEFRYGPGDMILIPQGVPHMVEQDADVGSHLFAIHFHAQVYGAINLLTMLEMPYLVHSTRLADFEASSQRMAREFAVKAPAWRTLMNTEVLLVLFNILRERAASCHARVTGPTLSELPRFLPVFEQIEARLGDSNFCVPDMAKTVFLSEVQFRKLFRRVTGMNPIRFVQRRRIEKSCVLLQTTGKTIEVIAEECGFCDAPFFYRAFRKWISMTPSQYRHSRRF
jgi:AraC-like DNA-binding protein